TLASSSSSSEWEGAAAISGARGAWPAANGGGAAANASGTTGRRPSMRRRNPDFSISRPDRPRSTTRSMSSRISLIESIVLQQLLLQLRRGLPQLEAASSEVAVAGEQEEQIILLGHAAQQRRRTAGRHGQLRDRSVVGEGPCGVGGLDDGSRL